MALAALGLFWLLVLWWAWLRRDRPAWRGLARDLLAGGLLFLLTLGFFWRTLSGDVYQPADGGDLVSFLFPTYRFAAEQLRQGVLPLWNPHLYGGAPFISDIQAGFLYPPNLLLFLVKPDFAYPTMQWLAIGHLYWAGLGLYVLLRTVCWADGEPVARPAALFAALAFQFSDPLLIHLGNLNLIAVLSWLPWVLAAYHRALVEHNLRWAALAALLFAVGNYAGHAQSSLYIGLAIAIYTVVWVGVALRDRRPEAGALWGGLLRPTLQVALICLIITGLLTAPILLPAVELAGYTERSHFRYQEMVDFSLAPTQALGLVAPGFFGRGPALHWGLWQRVETPFAGVATLLLAIAGVTLAGSATRRLLWPWIALALFGFITALGVYAILHGWLAMLMPGFDQLRAPARALILWTLGLAVLSAVGLDQIMRAQTPAPARALDFVLKAGGLLLAGVFAPLLYVALLLTQQQPDAFLRASVAALAVTLAAGCWLATWALVAARRARWLGGGLAAALLIAVLYFDLAAAGAYTDISSTDPTRGYQHPELVSFLRAEGAGYRIDANTGIDDLWQPDAAALHGLEDIGGIANPLALAHWQALLAATGGRHTRLYDMLNAGYLVARDGTPLPEGKFELAFDAPGELAVYRNADALPRAWVVHAARAEADPNAALDMMQDETFDPARIVLLHTDGDAPMEARGAGPSVAAVVAAHANGMTVRVNASAPGYLVLSEVWYPGWRATVNGQPTAVLRANHALRAIPIPAGEATVVLRFAPQPWRWGLVGLGIGMVLIGLVARRPLRRDSYGRHSLRSPITTIIEAHRRNIERPSGRPPGTQRVSPTK